MKQINCETEIKKRYFRTKNATQTLIRIISESNDISEIENLYAYTPNKLKFSGPRLIDCIKANKKLTRFGYFSYQKPVLVTEKNGCIVSVYYELDYPYLIPIKIIKIQVSGPEENVKQAREALCGLL